MSPVEILINLIYYLPGFYLLLTARRKCLVFANYLAAHYNI
jgi:hypothetical protein